MKKDKQIKKAIEKVQNTVSKSEYTRTSDYYVGIFDAFQWVLNDEE